MKIYILDEQKDLKINPSAVQSLVSEVITSEGQNCDEVSVNFVSTEKICELHDRFFDDPSPTDCISLPLDEDEDEEYRLLGEIFVCPKTAQEFIKKNGGDIYEETSLYVVHSLLHLMGYDDIGDPEPAMRAAEEKHMHNLKTKNLILHQ